MGTDLGLVTGMGIEVDREVLLENLVVRKEELQLITSLHLG